MLGQVIECLGGRVLEALAFGYELNRLHFPVPDYFCIGLEGIAIIVPTPLLGNKKFLLKI